MKKSSIGIAWYSREDWPRAIKVFSDRLLLPSSYDKWLASAEVLAESIRHRGATPVKVYIDPSQFNQWCMDQGLQPNAKARSEYAKRSAEAEQSED